jgi:RNA 2',3'-cyclic 3'-phosphodiesterase
MPRLFTAIEIPEIVRAQLTLVRGHLPGAKWIEMEDLHLTIRFFGDISNLEADELVSALARVDFDPFELRITGLGVFGGRDPRALFAAVGECEPLNALYRASERAARAARLPPETRAFKPHITLARLKNAKPEMVARFLSARPPLQTWPFTVDQFILMSSRPGIGGGPYVREEHFHARPAWDTAQ